MAKLKKSVRSNRVATAKMLPKLAVTTLDKRPAGLINKHKFIKPALIAVFLIGILALGWQRYKNLFVVAMVDGRPIFRSELNNRLLSQYGSQTMEGLIGEKLILENAQKQNINITQKEIDERIVEIEKSLNGMKLDEALKLQGMNKADFISRQKIQLSIDKMFAKDVSVSAAEIDDFIKNNSMYLTATEAAQKLVEAEATIRNNKIEQKFTEWFNKIKEEAKVSRFL